MPCKFCHQSQCLNFLCKVRGQSQVLCIAVCLLCSASPMDTKSFTASFLLGKHLLPQNCIFPSSRGTKPSLRHFCAHMVLVPHLWHCSFSLQIEKSCLPQENCPFPQNTLQTPLYFFVLPSWEKRKAAVTFPSLSILTPYRCLMDMTTLDAHDLPWVLPIAAGCSAPCSDLCKAQGKSCVVSWLHFCTLIYR